MDVINRKFPENLGATRSHLDTHATGKEQLPLITPHAHRSRVLPTAPRSPWPPSPPLGCSPQTCRVSGNVEGELGHKPAGEGGDGGKGQAAVGVHRMHLPALGIKAAFLGEVTAKC